MIHRGRLVTLVLCRPAGEVLGSLPPYEVELPYWQEVSDVVAGAKTQYGIDVEVLRLLTTENSEPHGGAVTYLAELVGDRTPRPPPLEAVGAHLAQLAAGDEPLRQPYARPGGPAESLAWAREQLGEEFVSGQQRTWNLSAIWRLEQEGAAESAEEPRSVWLKQVPPFFAHEVAVLEWATREVPGSTPPLLGAGPERRLLLGHVEGDDLYESTVAERIQIVAVAHRIQKASFPAVDELITAGVPDRRAAAMARWIRAELREHADHVGGHPAADLLDGLDERLARASACGLPDALVHGDEHPGNAIARRGVAEARDPIVLLDWGDSYVGHPAFDALRLGVGLPPTEAEQVVTAWVETWRNAFPASDPRRAVELIRPVEPLRLAAVYASFLRQIEPSERRYHAADVSACLDRAVGMLPS